VKDGVSGSTKGHWSSDYFVTFLESGNDHGQVESSGTGVEGKCIARADIVLEECFESGNFWAGRNPTRLEGVHNFINLGLTDEGTAKH
jgi:hypothetical protein